MSVFLLAAAIALLVMPGVSLGPSRHIGPRRYAGAVAFSVTAGAFFLEAALALAAVPTVLRLFGLTQLASLCERVAGHLVPGGAVTGWLAALSALALPVLMASGVHKSVGDRRLLWNYAEALGRSLGCAGECDIVVLDSARSLAIALPGEPARIVLSSGLMEGLEDHELRAVIQHERAHIELGHHRHQLMLGGLSQCFGWLPPVARSLRAWRFTIERTADERAAGSARSDRLAVRDAIRKVAIAPVPAAWAGLAFSPSALTEERIRMLERTPKRSRFVAVMVWVGLGLGVGLAASALIAWIGHTHHLAVVAAFCHL